MVQVRSLPCRNSEARIISNPLHNRSRSTEVNRNRCDSMNYQGAFGPGQVGSPGNPITPFTLPNVGCRKSSREFAGCVEHCKDHPPFCGKARYPICYPIQSTLSNCRLAVFCKQVYRPFSPSNSLTLRVPLRLVSTVKESWPQSLSASLRSASTASRPSGVFRASFGVFKPRAGIS